MMFRCMTVLRCKCGSKTWNYWCLQYFSEWCFVSLLSLRERLWIPQQACTHSSPKLRHVMLHAATKVNVCAIVMCSG